jgi:folate-dependent phosphoribosylglycinamide formyltransferase PurN
MLNDLLHVGVLCSKHAPGLDALLRHPLRGSFYEVKCVVTSEANFCECAVPVLAHPIRQLYDENRAPLHDKRVRRFYDGETALILRRFGVDTVLLLGYLYVITEPLLSAFPDRILNVHDGSPNYPGLHATRDAILAGEPETRSVVHIVTKELDSGPVVARSAAFPVAPFVREAVAAGESDIVRAYAYAHREWMMRSSWGDLVVRTLECVAARQEVAV